MNSENIQKIIEEFIEKGANLEHERWAGWQKYLFSKCNSVDGDKVIPAELVVRWQRQIDTSYSKLSEIEKESDRKETRNYVPLLLSSLHQIRQETLVGVVGTIEEKKKYTGGGTKEREMIYNSAITDIINLIQSKKENI